MDSNALRRIDSEDALREVIGSPTALVCSKVVDRLNALTRTFIEASPLVCLATSDGAGNCDVTPRGDPAGFVRIVDEQTLLLPERPGNRLADGLSNIIANPHVGLLFLIPGLADTFRVNGRAFITDDRDLLAPSSVEGRAPRLGIVIEIDEAYTQCSKAFLRSDLWNPQRYRTADDFPTGGQIMSLLNANTLDAVMYDVERAARYDRREGFY
jgi:uncharacterized protein